MVGWHHRLNGHESEQTPRDSKGQGSLACCSPWGRRVGHNLAAEQQLNLIHRGELDLGTPCFQCLAFNKCGINKMFAYQSLT